MRYITCYLLLTGDCLVICFRSNYLCNSSCVQTLLPSIPSNIPQQYHGVPTTFTSLLCHSSTKLCRCHTHHHHAPPSNISCYYCLPEPCFRSNYDFSYENGFFRKYHLKKLKARTQIFPTVYRTSFSDYKFCSNSEKIAVFDIWHDIREITLYSLASSSGNLYFILYRTYHTYL